MPGFSGALGHRWTDAQQHQRFPVQRPFGRGEDSGGSGSRTGSEVYSLDHRTAGSSPAEITFWTQMGEVMNGVSLKVMKGLQVGMMGPQRAHGH